MGDEFSILVSGSDLTGKTTLSERLARELKTNHEVTLNKYSLGNAPFYKWGECLIQKDWQRYKRVINGLFAASFIYDTMFYEQPPRTILVQDSYAQRTIAFCDAHEMAGIAGVLRAAKPILYHFDVNILLVTDMSIRQERAQVRKETFDREAITCPEKVRIMDASLEREIEAERNYCRIDTGVQSIDEMTHTVIQHLRKRNFL